VLESREAELRLAQARRIPNIFVGPLYRLDNEDQVIGGSINIPLPPFNRNPEEIATAAANRDVAHTELQARRLATAQEVASAYARVTVAVAQLASYEPAYVDELARSRAFARKAYETGELNIFEFSATQDRVAQAHLLYLEAILAYVHARAELDARLAFGCSEPAESERSGQ
jgi:outer membrane protein TolC